MGRIPNTDRDAGRGHATATRGQDRVRGRHSQANDLDPGRSERTGTTRRRPYRRSRESTTKSASRHDRAGSVRRCRSLNSSASRSGRAAARTTVTRSHRQCEDGRNDDSAELSSHVPALLATVRPIVVTPPFGPDPSLNQTGPTAAPISIVDVGSTVCTDDQPLTSTNPYRCTAAHGRPPRRDLPPARPTDRRRQAEPRRRGAPAPSAPSVSRVVSECHRYSLAPARDSRRSSTASSRPHRAGVSSAARSHWPGHVAQPRRSVRRH